MMPMAAEPIKARIANALREYVQHDLHPSHLIIAAMIVVGALVNLTVPHGWTVWPFVAAFGILTYINEAVDRNGQGIPPAKVYAFLFGGTVAWIVLVAVLSRINPLIVMLGIIAIVYRTAQALLRQRERNRLIAARRADGRCIHCGETIDPKAAICLSCGEEPNPDEALLKRVSQIYRGSDDVARARATLSRAAAGSSASAKERALLSRHQTGKVTPPAGLPRAAKLGPSATSKRNRG
jgi:hypothetical protein